MTTAKLLTLAIGVIFVALSLHFVVSGMFNFHYWENLCGSFASLQNPKTSCFPAPSPEDDRDFKEDIEEFGENVETTLTNTWNKIYGSQCQTDDQVREA